MSVCYFIPPSNTTALHNYYTERQLNIKIPSEYSKIIKGTNIRVLSTKYNINIQTIDIISEENTQFILTHNNWLKTTDPNNKIQKCKEDITELYNKATRYELDYLESII